MSADGSDGHESSVSQPRVLDDVSEVTFLRPVEALRSGGRRRHVVAVALAAAALGCAVVALVGPADVDRGTFVWSAADDPLDIPLVLSASRPRSMEVVAPCALARVPGAADGRQLFTTSRTGGGLTIASNGRAMVARAGGAVLSLPIARTSSCEATVTFDINEGVLRLRVGSSETEAHLERGAQPIVTGLHADPSVAGSALSARIVTQPAGSSPSRRQLLAVGGGIACLLATAALLLRRHREQPAESKPGDARTPRVWLPTPVLVASDAAVAFMALASAVLTPTTFDDGWVLATVRGFASTGRFSTYYERDAAIVIQGGWWNALLYPVLSTISNVVVLRLIFVAFAVLAWWVVRRWIIDQWGTGRARRNARFAGAATAGLLVPAWMTTLRPEPLVALLAAVAMVATVRFCQRPSLAPLVAALATGALAMTLHQTGWVVVVTTMPIVLFLVPWLRAERGSGRLLVLVAAVLGVASASLLLVGFDTDIGLLRSAAADFTAVGTGYSNGPFDEWTRPLEVVVLHSAVRRAAMVLPLLALVAVVATRTREAELSSQRLTLWCAVAGYLGLALTSSKLVWHYGSVMPFTIVLVAAAFQRLLADQSRWPALKRGLAAVCLALLGAWALSSAEVWNRFDLASFTWTKLRRINVLAHLDASRSIVWLTALAFAAALLLGIRARKRQAIDVTRSLLALALAAACLVPVGLTWSLLIRDARSTDGWSFTGQLLDSATGRDECGLPDELPVVASADPLDRTSNPVDMALAVPDGYDHRPPNARLPVARVDTWGTRATRPNDANPDRAIGRSSTPWYALRRGDDLAFWVVGRASGSNRIVFEARDAAGMTVVSQIARPTGTPYWSINHVPALPRAAVAVRLVLQDNDAAAGGWLAATAPARVDFKPLAGTLSPADRVWVAPQYYPYAPCVELPPLTHGYLQPFAAIVVGAPTRGLALRLLAEAPVVQTGCITAGPCAYRVTAADAASLLRR